MASQPQSHSETLPNFYQSWLTTQQSLLHQLLDSQTQTHHKDEPAQLRLINQVLSHYRHYYDHLSRAAAEDIFRVLSAFWLSPFERTLLWISGFKPSLLFRFLSAAVNDLTPAQAARVEDLRAEVRRKERDLTQAMASLQESVAAPPILGLARPAGTESLVDGEICEMEIAIEELKMAMLGVFDRADLLRGLTVMQVMEILNSDQMVRLLAAAAEFQLRIRSWGVRRDLQRDRATRSSSPLPPPEQ